MWIIINIYTKNYLWGKEECELLWLGTLLTGSLSADTGYSFADL